MISYRVRFTAFICKLTDNITKRFTTTSRFFVCLHHQTKHCHRRCRRRRRRYRRRRRRRRCRRRCHCRHRCSCSHQLSWLSLPLLMSSTQQCLADFAVRFAVAVAVAFHCPHFIARPTSRFFLLAPPQHCRRRCRCRFHYGCSCSQFLVEIVVASTACMQWCAGLYTLLLLHFDATRAR